MSQDPYESIAKPVADPYASIAVQAKPQNTGSITLAPRTGFLDRAEQDVMQGGAQTVVGKALGFLQGRGARGFSGVHSGASEGAADIIGSPAAAVTHLAQGAGKIILNPTHPVEGLQRMAQGTREAITLPGLVVGGPEGAAALNLVPSASHAASVLNSIGEAAAKTPVVLSRTAPVLDELRNLGDTGSTLPKVVRQLSAQAGKATQPRSLPLLKSMQNDLSGVADTAQPTPLLYPKARDFYKNVTSLSAAEKMELTPALKYGMGNLREAFKADIGDAADAVGRGEDYAKAMREYASAQKLKEGAATVGKKALKYIVLPLAAGAAAKLGYDHARGGGGYE